MVIVKTVSGASDEPIVGHTGVSSVVFGSDGATFVAGGLNKTMKLWRSR
jgi:WD40 repeat protein